jgi:thiamine-monophosphate kinase
MRSRQADFSSAGERGELALLSQIRSRAAQIPRSGLRLGIGDDCAILRPRPDEELAITTDLSIAGEHFRLDWHQPESVGHRVLARGLSDLAAMGARPIAAFLSLGLPLELTKAIGRRSPSTWVDGFLDGLLSLARGCKTPLAGGDLSESPVAIADIVLVGGVPCGKALLRSGARPGDLLYVTGSLGGAAAGLGRLTELAKSSGPAEAQPARLRPPRIPKRLEALLAPHLYPQPRIAQGLWLRRRGLATAALDLSDGLSTDLAHLCRESGVAAEVNEGALPIHPAATLDQALNGGEDYELLFAARATARVPRAVAGVPITKIGRILPRRSGRPTVTLLTGRGSQPLKPQGWEHFS